MPRQVHSKKTKRVKLKRDKDNCDTQTGDLPQPSFALACSLHVFYICFYNMFQCSSGASGCPNRTLGKASMLASRRCVVAFASTRQRHDTPPLTGPTPSPPHALCERPRQSRHANTTGVTSGGVLEETHRAK